MDRIEVELSESPAAPSDDTNICSGGPSHVFDSSAGEQFRSGGGQGDEAQLIDGQRVEQPSFVPGPQRSALPRRHGRDAPARLPRRCTSPTWHCWTAGPVAESGGHGWKQPCLRPRLGIPPCRSSGGGWKTRFISPRQDGILLPIPARGAAG